MNRNWGEVIGGIFLVPVLHFGFVLLLFLLGAIFSGASILGILCFLGVFYMGLAQFFYLIPVVLVLRRRREFELVKGISIGAILTILVNGACFGSLPAILGTSINNDAGDVIRIGFITVILGTITFYGFNYRSRPK